MSIFDLRRKHGEVYASELPDGTVIPWKPLSFGDFIYYTRLESEGRIPSDVLEDEIFRKCVVDTIYIDSISELRAGTVSTVAAQILSYSGTTEAEEFNVYLSQKRSEINNVLDRFVIIICRWFPAYKPEDVYSMNFDTMLGRLAQAESLMMELNPDAQPFELVTEEAPERPQQVQSKGDELHHGGEKYVIVNIGEADNPLLKIDPTLKDRKSKDDAPTSKALQKRINFKGLHNDAVDTSQFMTNWEIFDRPLTEKKMLDELVISHPELIKGLYEERQKKKE